MKDKRRIAHELRAAGVPVKKVSEQLNISPGRVSQLVQEYDADNGMADGDLDASARVLRARATVLELQAKKLKRELALEAGKLLRAENLDRILQTFLRHFEAQTDWIRSNRTGDHELMKAHLASVDGARRECHAAKITEGCNIDEIEDD